MKKFLALCLTLVLLAGILPVGAEGLDSAITVYLSISQYGEFVTTDDGDVFAYLPVNLDGKESYNIDDALSMAHSLYHPDGVEAYASSIGEWGLGIDKLWGDSSTLFGYQVNSGRESVRDLSYMVEDGDVIDACIYRSRYPKTENYSWFDRMQMDVDIHTEFSLTLSCFDGYDPITWEQMVAPCEGATITVNGEETELVTDENGTATLTLNEVGTYTISAKKTKMDGDSEVPAITAPVCLVTAKKNPVDEVLDGIAGFYANCNLKDAKGNLPWILADMMVYETLYPESGNVLSESKKEEGFEALIAFAEGAEIPGDLAKSILALRAMGCDAKQVYTQDFEKIDLVAKLTALVDAQDEGVTNIYTLPYVMIALNQAEGYATEEEKAWMIDEALQSKGEWQSTADGTDAMTPMILALSPYYHTNGEVKIAIDDAVDILKAEQREDGLIDGFEGYEPASTGLALCAFSAIRIDASEVICGENSLVDGLLSTVNEEKNGFPNAFATEQGFRGLLAWRLLTENQGKTIYDFSDCLMAEANASGAELCPVVFAINPNTATVTVEGEQAIRNNVFDLAAGNYNYTASLAGYQTTTGTFTVTEEEETARNAKTITISLSANYVGGGGGGGGYVPPVKEEQKPEEEPEKVKPEKPVFTEKTFVDVTKTDWFYPSVTYVYENKLFEGTEKGFEPNTAMSRAMLVTVLYRLHGEESTEGESDFADVPENMWYTQSIKWAEKNQIVSGVSATAFEPDTDITREQMALILYRYAVFCGYDTNLEGETLPSYQDENQVSGYARDAIAYMLVSGLMNGKSGTSLAPLDGATRAEVATILMRFAEMSYEK